MNKISICTVCGNRLVHLKETLPRNIIENADYPNVEFIVLDYNSKDGAEEWARTAMAEYIESGVLKYYKTTEPAYFNLSHSKNMALRLATGDILCMVDADNFAGVNYADWVNTVFTSCGAHSIITTLRPNFIPYQDQGGKLCFPRDLFYAVRGFDEAMIGYGMDDVDLVNRLERAGGNRVFITENKYLKFISHSNAERIKNYHLINNLDSLYLKVSTLMNKKNRVLYFLKDGTYYDMDYEFDGLTRTNGVLSHGGWKLIADNCSQGSFERKAQSLLLTAEGRSPTELYNADSNGILSSEAAGERISWKKITGEDKLYVRLVMAFGECVNRFKYVQNDNGSNDNDVNTNGWGQGNLYRNFDMGTLIRIG